MKLLTCMTMAAMLAAAAPVWAHGGHGHAKKARVVTYVHHVPPGHLKQHSRHHVRYHRPRPAVTYYHYTHVYPAYPVYAPAPGIHVVLPNIHIPFPR
jgi:hypothetical protein